MMAWPSSFIRALSPRLWRRRTLRKSSMKPSRPSETNRPSSTTLVAVGPVGAPSCSWGRYTKTTCPATYATRVATMNTTPPIVGVPFLP
jgi:hypothetical protein